MIRRIVRRLLGGLLTVFSIYAITFLMAVTLPGNPFQQGERSIPPEVAAAFRARYNMDNNWLFFGQFLKRAALLDFGPSLSYADWTCNEIIASSLPVSMLLGLSAVLLAATVGIPVGILSAVHRGKTLDVLSQTLVLIGISVPTFVFGTALLTVFGIMLKIAPAGGWGTLGHLPLPAITLALPFTAYIVRLARVSMIDVVNSDFIRTSMAKGLGRRAVIWKHGARIALLPVLTFLGPATAQAMTGSFVVEKVFAVPGLGHHFVNAALNRDVGLVMSTVLVYSVLLVALNIAVDALYVWVDPRTSE